MASPRQRRLQSDYEALKVRFGNDGPVQLRNTRGNPPERYEIAYNVKGLEVKPDGTIVSRTQHIAEINLTTGYPRQAPQCKMLTPIFHPNFDPSAICIGDHWAASESLADLVSRIGEMITYQSYNTKSPLNGEAARWADENSNKLPVDKTDFFPAEGTVSGLPDSEPQEPPATSDALRRCSNCHSPQLETALLEVKPGVYACEDCLVDCPACGQPMMVGDRKCQSCVGGRAQNAYSATPEQSETSRPAHSHTGMQSHAPAAASTSVKPGPKPALVSCVRCGTPTANNNAHCPDCLKKYGEPRLKAEAGLHEKVDSIKQLLNRGNYGAARAAVNRFLTETPDEPDLLHMQSVIEQEIVRVKTQLDRANEAFSQEQYWTFLSIIKELKRESGSSLESEKLANMRVAEATNLLLNIEGLIRDLPGTAMQQCREALKCCPDFPPAVAACEQASARIKQLTDERDQLEVSIRQYIDQGTTGTRNITELERLYKCLRTCLATLGDESPLKQEVAAVIDTWQHDISCAEQRIARKSTVRLTLRVALGIALCLASVSILIMSIPGGPLTDLLELLWGINSSAIGTQVAFWIISAICGVAGVGLLGSMLRPRVAEALARRAERRATEAAQQATPPPEMQNQTMLFIRRLTPLIVVVVLLGVLCAGYRVCASRSAEISGWLTSLPSRDQGNSKSAARHASAGAPPASTPSPTPTARPEGPWRIKEVMLSSMAPTSGGQFQLTFQSGGVKYFYAFLQLKTPPGEDALRQFRLLDKNMKPVGSIYGLRDGTDALLIFDGSWEDATDYTLSGMGFQERVEAIVVSKNNGL